MKKGLNGNYLSTARGEEERSSEVTNNLVRSLVNPPIEYSDTKRYNPGQLKRKGGAEDESLYSYHKNRRGKQMKNSLMIINALYKKGLVNAETISNIEKKYGRLDG